ncbi:hypothetical protein T09_7485 [Trichinella sp. T9]|nr:hypothetical protein T09_7485 [Trichinella sp. T9]
MNDGEYIALHCLLEESSQFHHKSNLTNRRRPTTNNSYASLDNEDEIKEQSYRQPTRRSTVNVIIISSGGAIVWRLRYTMVVVVVIANKYCIPVLARILLTKRELGKRGGRAGSNRTDDTDAEMNPQVDTGVSSFCNDRGSNPVEARNEPAREIGSLQWGPVREIVLKDCQLWTTWFNEDLLKYVG